MKTINTYTRYFLFTLFFAISNIEVKAQYSAELTNKYIETHKELAIEQMALYKIPASVIMAQAILESGSGNSALAKEANNHFGIKCHKEWGGDSVLQNDDELNERFRKYKSIEDSYLDHSLFLLSRPRYSFLFQLKPTDYFGWCVGLKKAGYATLPNYTHKLLFIIETFNLMQLDEVVPLNNITCYNSLTCVPEKDIIKTDSKNYFENIDTHLLAKIIFNTIGTEEPLLVRADFYTKKIN